VPIPKYFMPLYQVYRAPSYTPRLAPFHHWSCLALVREIKEMGLGLGVAVPPPPPGYVSSKSIAGIAALLDGMAVEITTVLQCNVAKAYFGNDEQNVN